jgi:hypothetical protein
MIKQNKERKMSKDKTMGEVKVTEKKDKDILVWAIPKEDKAEVESNSVEGMTFLQKQFGTATKDISVPSKDINPLFAKIVENKLTFSFKMKA